MGGVWITLTILWAVVEAVQWFRKRPFPSRMRAPAVWFAICGALMLEGYTPRDQSSFVTFAINLVLSTVVAASLYGLRVLLAKMWVKLEPTPVQSTPAKGFASTSSDAKSAKGAITEAIAPSEECWSAAFSEFESDRRPGLWAKVFAEAAGNDALAKSEYLRVRAHEIQSAQAVEGQNRRREAERLRAESDFARLSNGNFSSHQIIEVCEGQLRALGFEVERPRMDKWVISRNTHFSYAYTVEDLRRVATAYSAEDQRRRTTGLAGDAA